MMYPEIPVDGPFVGYVRSRRSLWNRIVDGLWLAFHRDSGQVFR